MERDKQEEKIPFNSSECFQKDKKLTYVVLSLGLELSEDRLMCQGWQREKMDSLYHWAAALTNPGTILPSAFLIFPFLSSLLLLVELEFSLIGNTSTLGKKFTV